MIKRAVIKRSCPSPRISPRNILFLTMDFKFLEFVIIDYLIWVESYMVYVVWIHNIAHQAKKMLLRV